MTLLRAHVLDCQQDIQDWVEGKISADYLRLKLRERIGLDQARDALAADAAAKWQPIATAPSNVAILVFIPQTEHYGPGIWRAIQVDMGSGKRWHSCGLHVGRDVPEYLTLTHWMPLPAVPVQP